MKNGFIYQTLLNKRVKEVSKGGKILALVLLFVFVSINVSLAQMINYERRIRYQKKKEASLLVKPKGNDSIDSVGVLKPLLKEMSFIKSLPKIGNRVEKSYDVNEDGVFQEHELRRYLKDVLSVFKSRRYYPAATDVLRYFDLDKDKKIRRSECDLIRLTIQ